MPPPHKLLAAFLAWIVLVALPRGPAHADEVAPDLERSDLRHVAQAELRRLVVALPANDQRRLVGIYAAFDDDSADPIAQVACDDDGDYVIVLSDAMLRLAAHIARAALQAKEPEVRPQAGRQPEGQKEPEVRPQAGRQPEGQKDHDEGDRKVEEYAAFVARAQVPEQRLLPPPPGFYVGGKRGPAAAAAYDERLGEILSFVVARELSHFRAGDLVCPHPTATKESGDDVWTRNEKRKAREVAHEVYPGRRAERDYEATARMLDVGRGEGGAVALLRFFEQFEVERRVSLGRFLPTYAADHPSSNVTLAIVRQVAEAHRREHEGT